MFIIFSQEKVRTISCKHSSTDMAGSTLAAADLKPFGDLDQNVRPIA